MKVRGVHGIPVKRRKKILQELFSCTARLEQSNMRTEDNSFQPLTIRDLEDALKHVRSDKAPGPDGLKVESLKIAKRTEAGKVLDKLNHLFREQEFPEEWKVTRVVLLPRYKSFLKLQIDLSYKHHGQYVLVADKREIESGIEGAIGHLRQPSWFPKGEVNDHGHFAERRERSAGRWNG